MSHVPFFRAGTAALIGSQTEEESRASILRKEGSHVIQASSGATEREGDSQAGGLGRPTPGGGEAGAPPAEAVKMEAQESGEERRPRQLLAPIMTLQAPASSPRHSQRVRIPSKKSTPLISELEMTAHVRAVTSSSGGKSSTGARKRGVRCMECAACLHSEDCGSCIYCKDKPKFGGPGVKKQACM